MEEMKAELKAEAYYLTDSKASAAGPVGFYLDCRGGREGGRTEEVLGTAPKYSVLHHKVVELLAIQVGRNGIFDMLPEALFTPLSLGYLGSTTTEIVEEIRRNRKQEQGNRVFFAPFDTELFHYSIELLRRQLEWPGKGANAAVQLLDDLCDHSFSFTEAQALAMISVLARGDRHKDDRIFLSQLLSRLFGLRIQIVEGPLPVQDSLPFRLDLGSLRLGVDSVLLGEMGDAGINFTDWLVEVLVAEPEVMAELATGDVLRRRVMEVLDFFVLVERNVHVVIVPEGAACATAAGSGRLGVNTYLQLEAA